MCDTVRPVAGLQAINVHRWVTGSPLLGRGTGTKTGTGQSGPRPDPKGGVACAAPGSLAQNLIRKKNTAPSQMRGTMPLPRPRPSHAGGLDNGGPMLA